MSTLIKSISKHGNELSCATKFIRQDRYFPRIEIPAGNNPWEFSNSIGAKRIGIGHRPQVIPETFGVALNALNTSDQIGHV